MNSRKSRNSFLFMTENRQFDYFIIISMILTGSHDSAIRWRTNSPMLGDYLGGRAARRFAGTLLRRLVTGFRVLAASNNCRMPCSNCPTAFSKAPSCPTRTIAMDGRRSNDGGRNTFTVSLD